MGDRRRDDSREPPTQPKDEREDKPGAYYYDDATGYEIFRPAADEVDEDIEEPGAEEPGCDDLKARCLRFENKG